MTLRLWFWTINISLLIFRICALFFVQIGLSNQTYQAWFYSKTLSLSYFDLPPLTPLIIKLSTYLLGGAAFAIRLPSALFLFLTSLIFYLALKRISDEKAAFFGFLLINIIPAFSLFSLFGSPVFSVFIFFCVLSFFLLSIIVTTQNKNLFYPLAVSLGLALLTNYLALLPILAFALFLIFSAKERFWLKRKEPYFLLGILFLFSLPIILWNVGNNWIGITIALKQNLKTLPFYAPLPIILSLFIAALAAVKLRRYFQNKAFKILAFAFIVCGIAFNAYLFSCISKKEIPKGFSSAFQLFLNDIYDDGKELSQEIIKTLESGGLRSKPFIFTNDASLAAKLSFILREKDYEILCFNEETDAYDLERREIIPFRNRNALFITRGSNYSDAQNYSKAFASSRKTKKLPTVVKDKEINVYYLTYFGFFKPASLDIKYKAADIGEAKDIWIELLRYDYAAFKFINRTIHNKVLDYPMSWISFCDSKGINIGLIVICSICVLLLWKYKRENFWTTLALFINALIVSTVITYVIKIYVARPRPLAHFGIENVVYFYEMVYKNSFPSGHTQAAFVMCFFVFMLIRKHWFLFSFLALGMGIERIYVGSHFPSDVLIGALIGIFSAFSVIKISQMFAKSAAGGRQKFPSLKRWTIKR